MSTEFDDKELFEGAMADAPAAQAEPEQPQAQAADEGQARDERGRFAAAQEQTEAQAEEPQPEGQAEEQPAKPAGQVPSFRLKEEAEAKRRLESEVAELRQQVASLTQQRPPQPQPAPVQQEQEDPTVAFFENPAAVLAQRDNQMLTAIGVTMARATPEGAKAYDDAYEALASLKQQNPGAFQATYASLISINPLQQPQALVNWHKQHLTQQRVGNDPDAFFARTLEERLTSDPAFAASLVEKLTGQARQAQTAPNGKPAIALPPSLSRATSAAPAVGSLGDMSDAALFNDALR